MAKKKQDVEPKRRQWPIPPVYVALMGVCLFCVLTFYALGTFRPMKHQVAGVDPVAYYSWARSILFDFDLDFANEFQRFDPRAEGEDAALTVRGAETPIGRVGNMFAMGAGLLWLPFLIVARMFAESSDGFGPVYFAAVAIANLVYGIAGLFLMFGALRRWFSDGVAAGASIAAWLCSPVLYYAFGQYTMSHACSFFAVALFFFLWARWRESDDWWRWGIIGLAVGLATIVRWQNITVALVVAVDILARRDLKQWPKAVASAAGAIIAFSPQSIAWKLLYGSFLTIPQGGGFMQWTSPDFITPLFSRAYGLITWTPLCAIGIIGLFLLPKENRLIFAAILAAFLAQMYVQFATGDAGWSYGARRMCNLVPFFAVGFALIYTRLKIDWRIAIGIVAIFGIWNYLFVLQYSGFLDTFYVERALQAIVAEHNVQPDQLAGMTQLPDGTPFNAGEFIDEHRFPQGGGPTWTQMFYDKIYVVMQIGISILLIGA